MARKTLKAASVKTSGFMVSYCNTHTHTHIGQYVCFSLSVCVGISLFPQHPSVFVFSNLSFGEVGRCQRTFNSSLICREHLVDAARRERERERWARAAEVTLPPCTLSNLLFHRDLAVLVGVEGNANVSEIKHMRLSVKLTTPVFHRQQNKPTSGGSLTFSPGRLVCMHCSWQRYTQVQ